jgi:hypothetical protein
MPVYTDYEPVPDDNKNGSSPTRMPEGNYQGKWVNDTFRYMASVIRILGNSAAFLPLGNTLGKYIGSLAFQNADDVAITGGFFRGRGYVFVGALMDFDGEWADYVAVYEDLFRRGWVVCDGRTVTNPYTQTQVTLPDYRGRYRRMFAIAGNAGDTFGAATQTTTEAGRHAHGGVTGGTALTAANLPLARTTVEVEALLDEDTIGQVSAQTASAHTHSIPTVEDHTHVVDMLPLSVNVITLKRVW